MKALERIFESFLWESRLVVRYFEHALSMSFTSALDLLQFAAGIALLGLALYLSHLGDKSHPD